MGARPWLAPSSPPPSPAQQGACSPSWRRSLTSRSTCRGLSAPPRRRTRWPAPWAPPPASGPASSPTWPPTSRRSSTPSTRASSRSSWPTTACDLTNHVCDFLGFKFFLGHVYKLNIPLFDLGTLANVFHCIFRNAEQFLKGQQFIFFNFEVLRLRGIVNY